MPGMEPNFLPLDNTHNVLALLQKGYTFIETSAGNDANPGFLVGIPHTAAPRDKEAHMLSQFLVKQPPVMYGVERAYFEA